MIDTVRAAVGDRGVYVMDRGGDRINLFKPFLDRKMRFIVRLVGDRDLKFRGRLRKAEDLARGCPVRYAERLVREEKSRDEHGPDKPL